MENFVCTRILSEKQINAGSVYHHEVFRYRPTNSAITTYFNPLEPWYRHLYTNYPQSSQFMYSNRSWQHIFLVISTSILMTCMSQLSLTILKRNLILIKNQLEFHFPKKTFYTIYVQLILHSNIIQRTEQNLLNIYKQKAFAHQ